MIIALITTVIIASLHYEDVVEEDKDGKPKIKPDRIDDLADTIRFYEGAEQYVLVAKLAKYYPCPSCPDQDSIFLYVGETWKFGVTINGQKGRYGNELPDDGLRYVTQLVGSLPRCLSEEKRKIMEYPILPENQKRKKKLVRPPGNLYDK